MPKKYFHDDDVIDDVTGWPQSRLSIFLYKWNNNIFHDNLTTSKDIIIKLPVHMFHKIMTTLYEYIFMMSLMTSPGHKIGQILKLIYLHQYFNYSVDQKLKMSEMPMAIFLVYSTSGTTSGKKLVASSNRRPFWNFWNIKHSFNEKIVPNYAKKSIFMMMTSSMTSQGGLKVGPLYSFIYEITTFFMITKQRAKISSLSFLCICIMRL